MSFLLDKKNQTKCGNITVWIAVIVISIIFSVFATLPATSKYIDLYSNISHLEEANLEYETDITVKTKKLKSITEKFNRIAKDFLKEEKLLFPESLDVNTLAKILELYSIQYSLIDGTSLFDLNSISFSKQTSGNYTKTSVSMSIKSTKKSLQDFIYFIQNNELPKKLLNAQNSSSSILRDDFSTTNFIRRNILPIANIESIVSAKSEDESDTIQGLLNTDIQVNFFSQKLKDEQ